MGALCLSDAARQKEARSKRPDPMAAMVLNALVGDLDEPTSKLEVGTRSWKRKGPTLNSALAPACSVLLFRLLLARCVVSVPVLPACCA